MCNHKKLYQEATAGFELQNDVFVKVIPALPNTGIKVYLSSPVTLQFGSHIKTFIIDIVKEAGYKDVILEINDTGAWDYTIKARVIAALERGMQYD